MDARGKFSGLAAVYVAGRPAYADKFFADLYEKFGCSADSTIADIGSGTGKFSRQLLERGSFVYCVEPNEDMRNQAVAELSAFENGRIIAGDASHTTLQDDSVDFVTAAQAFHWFDPESFKKECRRIIRPGGKVFLIWNSHDRDSRLTQELSRIYKEFCPRFEGFSGGIQKNDRKVEAFFDGKFERLEYDHPLLYDRDKFISRCLSSSYSLKQQDVHYVEYVSQFNRLFDEFADNQKITMGNKTVAYMGSVK